MHRSILAHAASGPGLAAIVLGVAATRSPAARQERLTRGAHIASIMACGDCHTTGSPAGKPDRERHLAGSQTGFQGPGLGTFCPPDPTT